MDRQIQPRSGDNSESFRLKVSDNEYESYES